MALVNPSARSAVAAREREQRPRGAVAAPLEERPDAAAKAGGDGPHNPGSGTHNACLTPVYAASRLERVRMQLLVERARAAR
jgi:hypothetical protein